MNNLKWIESDNQTCPECHKSTQLQIGTGADGKIWDYAERCPSCKWEVRFD